MTATKSVLMTVKTCGAKQLQQLRRSLASVCHRLPLATAIIVVAGSLPTPAHSAEREGRLTDQTYDPSHSVARNWNEALLFAIRHDFARPTVHARNLFHVSATLYDSWALFEEEPSLYFLGRTQAPDGSGLTACEFSADTRRAWQAMSEEQLHDARQTTLSYATYRLLSARFANSPGASESLPRFDDLFAALGLDATITSADISGEPNPARLGNYLANCVIDYGHTDGSNEANNYANTRYTVSNPPLDPTISGNPGLNDPNRWQSLQLNTFVDQSGNETNIPIFLGAEWSAVAPFALTTDDITLVGRDAMTFPTYLNPGPPAYLSDDPAVDMNYQHGHAMVAMWSSHLDPSDGVIWNISPARLGNIAALPATGASILDFYDAQNGGTQERGYVSNPVTGEAYPNVRIPRGDFTRVLAEFWADGPDSETPPGHWFQIYNTLVRDHPQFKLTLHDNGDDNGTDVESLEFDVRTYFTLGAAMHDSAIAAWSLKGAYDYIRPISALRYMASLGQSTDMSAANYHLHGVPLQPDFIETIQAGDPLAGNGGANVGKIKARAWRGPDLIRDPQTDTAGVGWILLENWWPYQRPDFVTPPFAGYVSGHSTFSRAAADVLTSLTGSEYFPGGLAEFTAIKDEFLVFEKGPSVDVTLQWASYRDASDQTSLSRIWGGIHPPVDDIPGRLVGSRVATRVLNKTQKYFNGEIDHNVAPQEDPGFDDSDDSFNSEFLSGSGAAFWLLLCAAATLAWRIQSFRCISLRLGTLPYRRGAHRTRCQGERRLLTSEELDQLPG